MRVVCIGDSITAGQYLPAGEKAWPALLEGFDVIARGVANDTTRLGLERFPRDVQELEPNVVVIQFGLNDCNRWESDRGLPRVSPAAFEANLREMIDRTLAFDAEPMLCTLTPTLKGDDFEQDAERYNALVHHVVRTSSRQLPLLDMRPWFATLPLAPLLLADGVHLSPAGHALYANVAQNMLARLAVPA